MARKSAYSLAIVVTFILSACGPNSATKEPREESEATAARMGFEQGDMKDMDDLKKDGFKCETIGAGGWECKKGNTIYLCDRTTKKCVKTQRTAPGEGNQFDIGDSSQEVEKAKLTDTPPEE